MSETANAFNAEDIPDAPTQSTGSRASGSFGTGFTRSAARGKKVIGHNPNRLDARLFGNQDVTEGLVNSTSYETSLDDRMSAEDAWSTTKRILSAYGLERCELGEIMTFLRALLAYHTFNSGSVLQPGRGKIKCLGNTFDYLTVIQILGNDQRRFFRAYADWTREENLRILNVDPNDPISLQHYNWLMQTARDRGLQRAPYLAHDSADACTGLTEGDYSLLAQSKRSILSNTINSADTIRSMAYVQSADKFDSTAGESVPHATGQTSGRAGAVGN